MSTATIYADTTDGRLRSAHNTYSSANTGANLAADPSSSQLYVGQVYDTGDDPDYTLDNLFFGFDTGPALPDTCTVDSVTAYLYIDGADTPRTWSIEMRLYDWGGSLTTADWASGSTLSSATLLASIAASSVGGAGLKTLTSETAFKSAVSKTGYTYVCVTSSRFTTASAPSDYERAYVSMAERGGSYRPKLVIEYTEAASGIGKLAWWLSAARWRSLWDPRPSGLLLPRSGGLLLPDTAI